MLQFAYYSRPFKFPCAIIPIIETEVMVAIPKIIESTSFVILYRIIFKVHADYIGEPSTTDI